MVIVGQDPYFSPKQAHGMFSLMFQKPLASPPFSFVLYEGRGLGSTTNPFSVTSDEGSV